MSLTTAVLKKKGGDSVGVAQQYCGNLGKVENCQVGVFAAYASRQCQMILQVITWIISLRIDLSPPVVLHDRLSLPFSAINDLA